MKNEYVQIEIEFSVLEHLFSALQVIRPNHVTKLEKKALDLLKDQIYYGLEAYMETEEEAETRKLKFKELFDEQRRKMYEKEKETAY